MQVPSPTLKLLNLRKASHPAPYGFFFLNNKTSLKENNQLQRTKAHRKCAEVNMKTNKIKVHEKYNY